MTKDINTQTREMLVGVLLGDAFIGRTGLDKAFISFEQSEKKIKYLKFLYSICQEAGFELDNIKTYIRKDSRYSKTNQSLYFRTKSIKELKPLSDLFLNEKGVKIIPSNIADYLTLISLAFWIMDDGQQEKKGGVTLCTDSFNLEEIQLLRIAMQKNFNLITSIHNKKGKNDNFYKRIYIFKNSLNEIKPYLKKYMHDTMLYKINLTPEQSNK